jgi:hypothetical protein
MSAEENETQTKYPWAGPALFITVLIALLVFLSWFLRA